VTIAANGQLQWNPDGVPIRQGDHIGWDGVAAQNGLGEVCVVWDDCRDGIKKIYAQKYNQYGESLWAEHGIQICGDDPRLSSPQCICATPNHGFIIAWLHHQIDTDGNIKAQKIDVNGNILWNPDGVDVCTAEGWESDVRIVSDGVGGAIFVWVDQRNGTYYDRDLYAIRLLSDGSLAPGWQVNGNVVSDAAGVQGQEDGPHICIDGVGGAIIAWCDTRNVGDMDVYAQRMDSSGNALWTVNGEPIGAYQDTQIRANIASDDSGGAYVVWDDRRHGGTNLDIYGQRVDANGNHQWTTNGVPFCSLSGCQLDPKIVRDGMGGAIIAWWDRRNSPDPYGTDIYGQRVDREGQNLWTAGGVAICLYSGTQYIEALVPDGTGGAYAVWLDSRNVAWQYDEVYAQYVTANGVPAWQDAGIPLSQGNHESILPVVFCEPDTGAFFVWGTARNDSVGVFIQKTDMDGRLQLPVNGAPVCQGIDGSVSDINLLAMPLNRFAAVWRDGRNDSTHRDIYLQIFDINANILLPRNGIIVCPECGPGFQETPKAMMSSDEGIIVTWADYDNILECRQIFAQKTDSDGTILWGNRGVHLSPSTLDQRHQYVCSDGCGGAYVAWVNQNASFNRNAFIQRVDSLGNLPWGPGGLEIIDHNFEDRVTGVVPDGEGNAIVVWYGFDAGYQNIFAARVMASGDTAWTRMITNGIYTHVNPVAIPSRSHGVVIVWEDYSGVMGCDLYGQKIDNSGNLLWGENGIPVVAVTNDQVDPRLIEDENGYIYVVWTDQNLYTMESHIYCQRISPDGIRQFPEEGLLVAGTTYNQSSANLITDGSTGVIICWTNAIGELEPELDVCAIHLDSLGQIADPVWQITGNPVCEYYGYQSSPVIVTDQQCGGIIAWDDRRCGYENLYAQRVNDFSGAIDNERISKIPRQILLRQPYPNPFNTNTILSYQLPNTEHVTIAIWNILGRKEVILFEGLQAAGQHRIIWDAAGYPSGIYFAQLQGGHDVKVIKMVLLK